jgi:hypothetical protein
MGSPAGGDRGLAALWGYAAVCPELLAASERF